MRQVILLFVFSASSLIGMAQKDESISVKIKAPKMNELIDKLWVDLSTDCSLPSSATVDKGEPECAGNALRHFRQMINNCKMTDAFKEAIKLEFKLIKLIPAGKVVGTILDIADLSAKAMSADSPEAFEGDLVKYGFGKVVGDEMVGKLKKLTNVPDGEAGDVLGNLTKLFYKQMWDKAKAAIFPKAEKYDCQKETKDCKDNINISIEPYTGDNEKVLAKLVFSINGNCNCKVACAQGMAGGYLNDFSVHGEMLIVIDKAEVVDDGMVFKSKVLQVTVKAEKPTYHIQADCDCTHGSNPYGRNPNTFYAGLGLVDEDAGTRFNTYGANLAYTYVVASAIGLTADAGVYFGSINGTVYTKEQLLAGVSILPASDKVAVQVAPHALAGIANVHSKYNMGNTSLTSSNTSFAAALGIDVMARLDKQTRVGLRLDYNPVFNKGTTSSNFRISAGLGFGVRKAAKK